MPAYVISDLSPRDPEAFQAYRMRAAAAIAKHGGRYLARGGEVVLLEGERTPDAVVIIEFPDMAAAQRWYASPEYAEALAFRDAGLARKLILVDGFVRAT